MSSGFIANQYELLNSVILKHSGGEVDITDAILAMSITEDVSYSDIQCSMAVVDSSGSLEAAQDSTVTTNIVYYKHKTKGTIISKDTYDSGAYTWSKLYGNQANYTAVRQYEYELEANEAKREIKLVDARVASKAFDVLREAMIENG